MIKACTMLKSCKIQKSSSSVVLQMESQSLPLGRASGFWKHDKGILKTPDQTGHARNSLVFWGEGDLCRLILLALQGGGWGAQWHPVLHQLGSRTLLLNANPPPVPQSPSKSALQCSSQCWAAEQATCKDPQCHYLYSEKIPHEDKDD